MRLQVLRVELSPQSIVIDLHNMPRPYGAGADERPARGSCCKQARCCKQGGRLDICPFARAPSETARQGVMQSSFSQNQWPSATHHVARCGRADVGLCLPRWRHGCRVPRTEEADHLAVFGNEGGFGCDLTGKLRISSRMTRMDIRNLESELRGQMNFIQTVAYRMNSLDAQRELEWATLECKKPEPSEESRGMSGVRIRPRD